MNEHPKIAIVGYGNMGREIERLAKQGGYIITDIFDLNNPFDPSARYDFDVAIDFTLPDSALKNAGLLSATGKNIVMGTTGWYDRKADLEDMIKANGIGLVWGSNFSIGMNMFFKIVESAASLMDKVEGFDIMVHEMHHKRKKDSPGGSALNIGRIILDNVRAKTEIETEAVQGQIKENELHVSSTRGGEVVGRHMVYMDSLYDSIELTHRAKSRTGFAAGSLVAADWIHGRQGFYAFDEVLKDLWG